MYAPCTRPATHTERMAGEEFPTCDVCGALHVGAVDTCGGCDGRLVPSEDRWVHADSGSTKCYAAVPA